MNQNARHSRRLGSNLQKHIDIIRAILESRYKDVLSALEADGNLINAVHEPTGMNVPMLAAAGRLASYIDAMADYGAHLNFSHCDKDGENLLEIALSSLHKPTIRAVQALYETHARHIINNWPEPGN